MVRESKRFVGQLRGLPWEVQHVWERKTRPALEAGQWNGLKFDKKAGTKDIYRCRIGIHYRAEFQHLGGNEFEAVRIGSRESL